MGTDKRARQKAGRQQRIEAAEAERRRREARNRVIRIASIVGVVVIVVAAAAYLRRDSGTSVDAGASTSTTIDPSLASTTIDPAAATGTSIAPASTVAPPPTIAGATITGDTPCPPTDGSARRTTTFEKAPPTCIDPAKTYAARVSTTKGDFTITLDQKSAPLAVNNFVVLSLYHFYDGTEFHRVIPDFVVQGGDAVGQPAGTGGPGYKFKDELPSSATLYTPGVVAMANSGADTNGSQFYIVLKAGSLEAKYSIFGNVTDGFDTTIKKIEAGGSASGTPTDPTYINSIAIAVATGGP